MHFLELYYKVQTGLFWFLSFAIALVSYRFVLLGMEMGFPNMAHQFTSYKLVLYAHIICGPIALVLAPFQLSKRFRTKSIARHRMIGRAYCAAILVAGLSGIVIGFNAMAGPVARAGFILLGVVWLAVTFRSLLFAMSGAIDRHRDWMIRSIALTFAGVTLRILLPLQLISGVPFDAAYQVVAWMCWVPNLIVAEYVIRKRGALSG